MRAKITQTALLTLALITLSGCVSMNKYRETKGNMLFYKDRFDRMNDQTNELEEKINELEDEISRLRSSLDDASADTRIAELEEMIAERDRILSQVRQQLSDAVGHLEGKGLSLVNKNGKIYVLMDDKLLFESGKYDLTKEGSAAIRNISGVLAKITNVEIVIEGHTDNKSLRKKEGAQIVDNWDLSCKRATEVVRVMAATRGIEPGRITASGRSYYIPVGSNNTESGRAQNRRTEIILTPKLDKVIELLK